ncbi:NAD(P)-binding protein [Pseudactinotalea sp. HY160]|uniref:FAD-dependent oxidoreductase n=1 Tax=Pseudactinotalea sp. HY160 TaxID=2654490 RepID=UPI00128E4000|nr:FAD-dependent oxidoreductase [Pseudactinotalea sp. HY160]MPV50313.1 NAD(P)-binding protein [Pseudactinotalea sp. HY160]
MSHAAVVVGGGIAGLAAAISLARTGWEVTVAERAATPTELGAGFAMARNAVAAFRALGFDDDTVGLLGYRTRAAGTWAFDGRPILTLADDARTRAAVALIGMNRRRIHHVLLERARAVGVDIETGLEVATLSAGAPGGAPAVVAGREADLVVGADGMFSAVRDALFSPHRLTYSGYSSWRALTARTPEVTTLRQFWGPHAEFGLIPVSEELTYWYGYVAMPSRTRLDDELAAARERFAGWARPVLDVMDATEPGAVMRHDVYHLPGGLPSYTHGRVVMIGDAAHGFLPTMGQGVATALEDGACIGLIIGHPVAAGGRLAPALAEFDAMRRPRSRALGRAAMATARIGAHLGGGRRQSVRNALMRVTPAGLVNRGADAAMGWQPPPPAAPRF